MICLLLLSSLALAAPPSSTLTGADGTLEWTVEDKGSSVHIRGSSPKWKVTHEARSDLSPVRTERTDPDGRKVIIEYRPTGATVHLPDKTLELDQDGLWDGDTLDVRLGFELTQGRDTFGFEGVDVATGKVYGFDVKPVGSEQCGSQPCTHLLVQLTGLLRWVGPSWDYWYSSAGQLLRFEGPAGTFAVESP